MRRKFKKNGKRLDRNTVDQLHAALRAKNAGARKLAQLFGVTTSTVSYHKKLVDAQLEKEEQDRLHDRTVTIPNLRDTSMNHMVRAEHGETENARLNGEIVRLEGERTRLRRVIRKLQDQLTMKIIGEEALD